MFLLKEYHRAAHIIKLRNLEKTHILCHYLTVESLLEAKEYQEAIELLNAVDVEQFASSFVQGSTEDVTTNKGIIDESLRAEVMASICMLKGRVLEAMDNRNLAMECYMQALQLSVHCTEALDSLVQHEMLLAWEEQELLSNLPFAQQCAEADAKIIRKLYKSKLKKYYENECAVGFLSSNFN